MKKAIALILTIFVLTISVSAQNNSDVKPPVDTAAVETTPLLSFSDVKVVIDKFLSEIPMKYAEPVRDALMALIQQRAQEYAQKKKLQPKSNK